MAAKKSAAHRAETHTPPPASSTLPPVADDGAGGKTALIITSAREGFRRAGRAWSVAPTRVAMSDFTAEQLAQLAAEPMLTVICEQPAGSAAQQAA